MTEDLSAQADGVTTAFSTADLFVPGSLKVYVDGIRYTLDDDYTETSLTLEAQNGFEMTQPVPVGSAFVVDYELIGGGLISASGT